MLAAALFAAGCVGRNQALVTTQRLKTSSEQASALVLLAKTNEVAGVQAHRELRAGYRQLVDRAWLSLLDAHQKALELESQKTLTRIEAEQSRILGEILKEDAKVQDLIDAKLDQSLAEVERGEATLESAALEARRYSREAPNDLKLLQKSLEVDTQYFAVAAKARDIELRARIRLAQELAKIDAGMQERVRSAALKQRERVVEAWVKAKEKLAGSKMPEIDLGPDPEGNPGFYDSIAGYMNSTQQAGRALEDYLESNWFGRKSLLVEYLRATGGGLVSGALKPGADLKGNFELLAGAAKGFGQDLLADVKESGQTAVSALVEEGRNLLEKKIEESVKAATSAAGDSKKP
jgi:hypothetical protein